MCMKNYWKPAKTSERVLSLLHHTAVAGVICMFSDESREKTATETHNNSGDSTNPNTYTLKHHLKEKKRN